LKNGKNYLSERVNYLYIAEEDMKKFVKRLVTVSGGLGIGFVNGFFGSGGGMLCVPLLEKACGENTRPAHATAILMILPVSIASAATYTASGFFGGISVLWVALGVTAGGVLGALLLKVLPAKVTGIAFAVVMIAGGVWISIKN
jgi:uncharacterized membrane protein YfcA